MLTRFLTVWTDNLYIFLPSSRSYNSHNTTFGSGMSLFCLLTLFYHFMTVQFSAPFIPAQDLVL